MITNTKSIVYGRTAYEGFAKAILTGGEPIVTACPTSRRMFERAGRQALDLVSVVRRWLAP